MEPLAAMIGTIVGYLTKKLKDNKSVRDFFDDFTDTTVEWVRPLFLKGDNQYEKIIEDLMINPDSPIKRQLVETVIASHLEDKPEDEIHLKEMYEKITANGSQLTLKELNTKEDIDVKVNQKSSSAEIQNLDAGKSIKIDIKQA